VSSPAPSSGRLPTAAAIASPTSTADTLARFAGTHVTALEPPALRAALAAAVSALVREGQDAGLAAAPAVAERLAELGG
jgi:hypothetical protein